MTSTERSATATQILADLQEGDPEAAQRLAPIVYDEMRALAAHLLAARRAGHTLQPTALANDVFMKLIQKTDVSWEGRAHFLALAAKAMRDLLVDHVRAKHAQKRGGGWQRITLTNLDARETERDVDLIDLEEALTRLGELHPRQERVVELRFFAGLTTAEVAQVLGVSERTVLYDWRMARAWLQSQLVGGDPK